MSTSIYIDNYRGFSKAWIPLESVNFLVGENSTGKTSFLELLSMFCTPMFWMFNPEFGIPGSHQRHFHDLVSASSKQKRHFTIGALSHESNETINGMLVTYRNFDGRPIPDRVSVIYDETIKTVVISSNHRTRQKSLKSNINCSSINYLSELHHSNYGFTNHEEKGRSARPILYEFGNFLFGENGIRRENHIPKIFQSKFVEMAPIRSKPRRTYDAPQTAFSPEGDHTPYIIRKTLSSKSKAESFEKFIGEVGRDSRLFDSINVRSYGRDSLSPFEIKILLGKTALGLDNVGYGVSQALPVIVEMFTRSKRSLFTIQQPEVHLHPRAQASIGDLIADFSRVDQKHFVIETHSDFTIDRFRLNIRKKGYIPSQILLFERFETGNKVTPISILEDGSLPTEQPESYREFFFNESLSLLG